MTAVERDCGESSHALVGAHLLALWGLPDAIVAAVARHHDPPAPTEAGVDPAAATYLAVALLDEHEHGTPVDLEYVAALGMTDRIDGWRSLAAESGQ